MERCCKTPLPCPWWPQDDLKNRLAEKLASYRRRLSIQFDQLFPKGKVAMPSIRSCANEHRQ